MNWSVNDTAGGSAALGTIDSNGKYAAPTTLPSPNAITIKAISAADTTKNGTSAVTLFNPTPTLTGISPSATNLGNYSLTVTGSNFVSGAHVMMNGSALATTFVSGTKLTATGNAATAGTFPVTVQNPDPGSSSSSAINFQVNGSTQAQARFEGLTEAWEAGSGQARSDTLDLYMGTRRSQRLTILPA